MHSNAPCPAWPTTKGEHANKVRCETPVGPALVSIPMNFWDATLDDAAVAVGPSGERRMWRAGVLGVRERGRGGAGCGGV